MVRDTAKSDHRVARGKDLAEGERCVVEVNGIEVGVFRVNGKIVAYENVCMHKGGPVCQGKILPRVEEVLDENQEQHGYRFSETHRHIICPWHGYEYDLETGRHPGHAGLRLRSVPAFERNGDVYVSV